MPPRSRLSQRHELVAVALLLAIAAAAVFGFHVARGGLYLDDWATAASYHFADSPRYAHAVGVQARELGNRPILAALLPVPTALFGTDAGLQILLGLLLAVAACSLFVLLLRTLGLEPLHSAALGVLMLLFPWADAIRLWPTASLNNVALCCGLGGLVLALRALPRGGRAATAHHLVAVALFVLSILTYEAMALALLLTGVVYRGRAPWGRVWRWWLTDAVAVAAALAWTAANTPKQVGSPGEAARHLTVFVRETSSLLALSFVPPGMTGTAVRLLVLLVALVVVVLGGRRWLARRNPEDGRWLIVLAAGCACIACAYAMFLPSRLTPLATGINNRINLFAALGYVAAVYAVAMLAARLVAPARTTGVGLALVALVGIGYVWRVADDERAWARSAALQDQVLDAAAPQLASVRRGVTLVTFGVPGEIENGPPVFEEDVEGAFRLRTHDRIRHAYSYFEGETLGCGASTLTLRTSPRAEPVTIPYADAFAFDAAQQAVSPLRDRAACLAAKRRSPAPRAVPIAWALAPS